MAGETCASMLDAIADVAIARVSATDDPIATDILADVAQYEAEQHLAAEAFFASAFRPQLSVVELELARETNLEDAITATARRMVAGWHDVRLRDTHAGAGEEIARRRVTDHAEVRAVHGPEARIDELATPERAESLAASPSTATTRARKRSNTRSCRLRANSAPVFADARRRCSMACLNASGEE